MECDCYKQGISGTFENDINDPIEARDYWKNIKFDDAVEIVERNEENE